MSYPLLMAKRMKVVNPARPRPRRRPVTDSEKRYAAEVSQQVKRWHRIDGRDRRFIQLFADSGYKDPQAAAIAAGFKDPYIGDRLATRLAEPIERERRRRSMAEQMEVDEALRILASLARTTEDQKLQHSALRTVLQVHGVLSDKPMPAEDRKSLGREIESIVDRLAKRLKSVPGSKLRLKAALAADLSHSDGEIESERISLELAPGHDSGDETV